MDCIILRNGLESTLHKKLIDKFGKDLADKKMVMFQSETFKKEFGDYESLMEQQLDFIPPQFSGRVNDKFEPELFEDNTGMYYLDAQYQRQYEDVVEPYLYNILQSQRAVSSLVEILANNYIEKGGFNLDFDTLDMSDNSSKQSLKESIVTHLDELGSELMMSDSDTLANNGGALFQILDDEKALDEMISKIKDFYKARNIAYNEEYNQEDVDPDTQEQRDPVFGQASFKVNPKSKVTAAVKIRLSLIKNPSDIDEDFGQSKSIDYNNLYNKITALLKNNPVTVDSQGKVEDIFETIIDKLKQHSDNIKYLNNVVEYLEKINRLPTKTNTIEGINVLNFKAGFVNVMNLQKNNYEYADVDSKEVVVVPAVTEKKTLANGAIVNVVIKEAITGKEYNYNKGDASKDTKAETSILNNWEYQLEEHFGFDSNNKGILTKDKLQERNEVVAKLKTLLTNKTHSNKDKAYNILEKLLPSVGININEAAFNIALNEFSNDKIDDAKLDQNYYNFIDNTLKTFEKMIENHNNGRPILNTYWYRQIAKGDAFFKEDGSESSVWTAGETRYLYSNPSYLHNKINTWKKDRQLLLDEYNTLSDYEKNSSLYKYLLALDVLNNEDKQLTTSKDRIAKFQINHFSSFRDKDNKKGKAKTNKDISKNEYVKDTVNGLLHFHIDGTTHTRTTTAPGKSTQYNIEHQLFLDAGFNTVNEEPEISTTVNLLFNEYLMAEFNRMAEQSEKVKKGKDLKVYYHTDKKGNTVNKDGQLVGNAFKSQLFPSLSFDKIKSTLKVYDGKPLYNTDGSIVTENIGFYKNDILAFIEQKVLDHVEDLKNDLIKYNVIERSGQNSYISKGIDSKIWKKYSGDNFALNDKQLFKMLGDIWLNGLVNHIEYSKVFSGDVAYYKDSVDYIKRIGASYTDGIYEYLSDVNKDFKIGIVESVEVREPYLAELKEVIKSDPELVKEWEKDDINAADAQAWITPKRWKSIYLGVGKYTTKHEAVYNKLTGKNKEALTPDELKLVAQPLKGVYFGRDAVGAPIYLKYSQAVLLPQLRNNTKLKDIFDFMENHEVDELLTFDAIKAGAVVPTKIHNDVSGVEVKDADGKFKPLNVMTLSSIGWKLQQDLPVKGYKETDIGSQILKNMLLLISDKLGSNEKIFTYGDTQYTAEEFAKELDSTLGQLVINGYNDLVKEFDIAQDGTINNIDKFYNTLADELVSRDASTEIIKALRAKLSIYAVPGLKSKLDNIFASIVNDRTVKIKTNGGSFIQMSNFGLSKEEADSDNINIKWSPTVELGGTTKPYTFKLNADGTRAKNMFGEDIISPEEILISGSFIAKYIPDYESRTSEELFGKLNPETNQMEGGLIDNKILENIIGYRIPNQGPSSNGAMRVVGILPAGMGDTIVAFTGITKKTGSDFDIDKMYIMFPNYKEKEGKLVYTSAEGNSKEAVQNKVIELYKSLILHQSNITKIMTPLDFPHIKMEAQNLAPAKEKSDLDNYEFVQDIVTKYSFLAGLAGVGQEANTSSDYAMGTMSDIYLSDVYLGERSHSGASLEVTRTNKSGEDYTTIADHTKFDKIRSQDISDAELKAWLDSYNKRAKKKLSYEDVKAYKSFAISDNISALMNAFVDIAKDPYITNVNWNMMTTNTGNMMLRAGVHPFIVMSTLAQPIISEYIDFIGQYENKDKSAQVSNSKDAFRIYKVGELIKTDLVHITTLENGEQIEMNARTLYELTTLYKYNLDMLNTKDFIAPRNLQTIKEKVGIPEKYELTEADIARIEESAKNIVKNHSIFFKNDFGVESFIINKPLGELRENVFKSNLHFQANTFNTFLTFQGYAKKLKSSVDASKHSVNGMGKNTTQLLIAINKIQNIQNKGVLNYDTKMKYEDGSPKLLTYQYQYNLLNTQQIVQSNPLLFVSSTPFVWNSYNQISKQVYGVNLEDDAQDGLGDKLDKTFNTYLMSGFEPFNMSPEERNRLIEEFPNKFIDFKNQYAGKYQIVDELFIKKTAERSYLILNNKTNSKEYTDNMINSWRDLIKYYPEFGNDLVKYSFLTSGFNNTTTSFFQFIPPSFFLQNNFNGYVKEFTKYPNEVDKNFIDHFYLSSLNDSRYVKYVSPTMKMKGQPYSKDGVTLFNAKVTKEFINVKGEFYRRLGSRQVKGEFENMYTQYIPVEGGYAKIKPIASEKDRGVTINEYNTRNVILPVDKTISPIMKAGLDEIYQYPFDETEVTQQEDDFTQEDVVVKEPLTNLSSTPPVIEGVFTKPETKVETKSVESKKDLLKQLFVKDTTHEVAKGSVVKYKDNTWIVWNITDNGGAQLINIAGEKFSGTPKLDKLTPIGYYTTTDFNGTDYIVTANENIYSLATGKKSFDSKDNSTVTQKNRLIEQIMEENDLKVKEEVVEYKEFNDFTEELETYYKEHKEELYADGVTKGFLQQALKDMTSEELIEYLKKCKG